MTLQSLEEAFGRQASAEDISQIFNQFDFGKELRPIANFSKVPSSSVPGLLP